MYELLFDVKLVKINMSIDHIEHTTTNATECFSSAVLNYILYQEVEVNVEPLGCVVPFD